MSVFVRKRSTGFLCLPAPCLSSGALLLLGALTLLAGCGSGDNGGPSAGGPHRESGNRRQPGSSSQRGGHPGSATPGRGGSPSGPPAAAGERGVPVEVAAVERRPIALYFETQGVLEAEQEVDVVARTAGPIVELKVEEGRRVRKDQLLARIDDREMKAQLSVSEVRLGETKQAYERAKALTNSGLISQETVDQALASYEAAQGDYERLKIQLQYTEIRAPYSGLIVARYVKFAQNVGVNERLFRLSDFDPLLCPIQVPEKELRRLHKGQPARLEVDAWPEETFDARVLRVSPVIDSGSGTVKVTLEVDGKDKLRPGMFASAFLEMESKPEALVVPKSALALDSLEDTVFIFQDGTAERRVLELGFRSQDSLEVVHGLSEGELVIVVGQDGLSAGTPVEVLKSSGGERRGPPPGFDPSNLTDEQAERIKERMRSRGLSEKQIEERLRRMREGGGPSDPGGPSGSGG